MIPEYVWQKSSYSADINACVEVALPGAVSAVRDTKDRDGGTLTFTPGKFQQFIDSVKRTDGWR